MVCAACNGAHRAHTCGERGNLSHLRPANQRTISSFVAPRTPAIQPGERIDASDVPDGETAGGIAEASDSSTPATAAALSSSSSGPHNSGGAGDGDSDVDGSALGTAAAAATTEDAKARDSLIPAPVLAKMKNLVKNFPKFSFGHLTGSDEIKKDYLENFGQKRLYFEFEDPDCSKEPDVVVASCRGLRIYLIRWELSFPRFQARCLCGRPLNGKRWQCNQANGFAKPVLLNGGERAYVTQWISECPGTCKAGKNRQTFGSCHPFILEQVEKQLGRHVRSKFPVEPCWAFPTYEFFLDAKLTRDIESTMVTYMPGDAWAKTLRNHGRELYDEHAADYDSHCGRWNKDLRALNSEAGVEFRRFPDFPDWIGREFMTGETLRRYHEEAWYVAKRNIERNIEMQQVRLKGDPSSSDHTHATLKNFYQQGGDGDGAAGKKATAIWDMVNNKTGEVVSAVCVASTEVGAYAHAASSLKILRGDKMGACFTDNWPTSEEVLKALWDMSYGRLDIWHWMRRMTTLLRDWHCFFYPALLALSQAVYDWNENDIADVTKALEKKQLNKKKYKDMKLEDIQKDIKEMKTSGKFFRNYVVYIRKVARKQNTVDLKMKEWRDTYAAKIDPKNGLPLAFPGFDAAFKRCLNQIEHLVDVEGGVDHNFAERPKPGSEHTLTRWRSSRGAKVETIHLPSKHYANLGTRARATQVLQMEGVTRDNADSRERAKMFVGEDGDASARAETQVGHYRPWVRRERNVLASEAGQPLPYPEDGTERPPDNGERFYYEYHLQQEERDREHGGTQTSEEIIAAGGCTCKECTLIRAIDAAATLSTAASSSSIVVNSRPFSRGPYAELVSSSSSSSSFSARVPSPSARAYQEQDRQLDEDYEGGEQGVVNDGGGDGGRARSEGIHDDDDDDSGGGGVRSGRGGICEDDDDDDYDDCGGDGGDGVRSGSGGDSSGDSGCGSGGGGGGVSSTQCGVCKSDTCVGICHKAVSSNRPPPALPRIAPLPLPVPLWWKNAVRSGWPTLLGGFTPFSSPPPVAPPVAPPVPLPPPLVPVPPRALRSQNPLPPPPPQQQPRKRGGAPLLHLAKKKKREACTCGALEETRKLRGSRTGPGGRYEAHKDSCPLIKYRKPKN